MSTNCPSRPAGGPDAWQLLVDLLAIADVEAPWDLGLPKTGEHYRVPDGDIRQHSGRFEPEHRAG